MTSRPAPQADPGSGARLRHLRLLGLAVLVGLGGAVLAVLFRDLLELLTTAFTGRPAYATSGGLPHPLLPGLGRWFLLGVPVLAGLLYGPLLAWWDPESRGSGVGPAVAAARGAAVIRPRTIWAKLLTSALCLGGGGSLGREGPIIQVGGALGSVAAQWLRLGRAQRRTLLGCGVAAGISATFATPLGGVCFAAEVVLGGAGPAGLLALATASVVAWLAATALMPPPSLVLLPQVHLGVGTALGALVVGALGAVACAAYMRVVRGAQDVADRLWRGPAWARPVCGGLVLGAALVALPELYGVGSEVIGAAAAGAYTTAFLVLLLVAKMLATGLSLGIGGSGGLVGPTLYVGAVLGAGCAQTLHAGPEPVYVLAGAAALLAAAFRAPVTAVVSTVELAGRPELVLPIGLAVLAAAVLARPLTSGRVFERPAQTGRDDPGATRQG